MSNSAARIAVLLADDHEVVRAGVAFMVNRQADMEVVAEAANGHEAVEMYAARRPDVALIDLRMPGVDGVECVSRIREIDADARVVILTTFDAEADIQLALQAGAKGFLLKDVAEIELVQGIRRAAAGQMCVSPAVATKLAERLQRAQPTARELDVLRLMAEGKPIGRLPAPYSLPRAPLSCTPTTCLRSWGHRHVRKRCGSQSDGG
ncbi:DNA-binding response regulator [Mycobacterium kansasii]|uniref:DNA-binding response regulator n=1 Tax=Mycobacterium kansasii TaxID=1768 RepID=A0A7G1IGR6_MYCKA|nr:DNA-binding response regulator [Mycobacterium kansasii]